MKYGLHSAIRAVSLLAVSVPAYAALPDLTVGVVHQQHGIFGNYGVSSVETKPVTDLWGAESVYVVGSPSGPPPNPRVLVDDGTGTYLDVVVCDFPSTAGVARDALDIIETTGLLFDRTEASCDRSAPQPFVTRIKHPAFPAGNGFAVPDPSHWVSPTGPNNSILYSRTQANVLNTNGVMSDVLAVVIHKATTVDGGPELVGWDIVINTQDFSGWSQAYPSVFAHDSGTGDDGSLKFGRDAIVHELMHVLGADHPSAWNDVMLHTSLRFNRATFPQHKAIEINADLYDRSGPQAGQNRLPMGDLRYLVDRYGVDGTDEQSEVSVVPWTYKDTELDFVSAAVVGDVVPFGFGLNGLVSGGQYVHGAYHDFASTSLCPGDGWTESEASGIELNAILSHLPHVSATHVETIFAEVWGDDIFTGQRIRLLDGQIVYNVGPEGELTLADPLTQGTRTGPYIDASELGTDATFVHYPNPGMSVSEWGVAGTYQMFLRFDEPAVDVFLPATYEFTPSVESPCAGE